MPQSLEPFLTPIICDPSARGTFSPNIANRRGPKTGAVPFDAKRHQAALRAERKQSRVSNIAVLDFETDPFDAATDAIIAPFLCVLYSDNFSPIIIWDDNEKTFIEKTIAAIEALPNAYTIYAHNGGKFDYMFLVHKLRGKVSFKGRAIMACTIGNHELRDSYHLIPERLASYKKDEISYDKMKRSVRHKHRQEIIDYCIADCRYLLELVKTFIEQYGFKMSIGGAAIAELKKSYDVKTLKGPTDAFIRGGFTRQDGTKTNGYYFGGRVECLAGLGHFKGKYKLYDVNSMYPFAMANYQHPIGNEYIIRPGKPNADTVFLELECFNKGALVTRAKNNETEATFGYGKFKTTIWEYETALKYGLIENVKVLLCVDNKERSNFKDFILPLYAKRQLVKAELKRLRTTGDDKTRAYEELKKDDIFLKLILNNSYGKFAENPRKYKDHFISSYGERPTSPLRDPEKRSIDLSTWGLVPQFESQEYCIWQRPSPGMKFRNVGTAASITGAARAILMEAIHNSEGAIYCDTDSLICLSLNANLHPTELGAWDLEKELSEVIICGKKLYAYREASTGIEHVKSKGASGLAFEQMFKLLYGETIKTKNAGATLTRTGKQYYLVRNIKATAKTKSAIDKSRKTPYRFSASRKVS